uniref:LETM2 N-terminal domain-containing protein n=1 Tax=Periophthalmus magnuspinnatus TaxID=409849 RepID=A0A3B3ZHV4_9GOBI
MAVFSHQVLFAVTRSRGSYLLSKRHSCSSLSSKAYLHVDPPHKFGVVSSRHSRYIYPNSNSLGHRATLFARSLHGSGAWLQDIKPEDNKPTAASAQDRMLVKKSLYHRVVDELKHYYNGFRLLGIDIMVWHLL